MVAPIIVTMKAVCIYWSMSLQLRKVVYGSSKAKSAFSFLGYKKQQNIGLYFYKKKRSNLKFTSMTQGDINFLLSVTHTLQRL